MPSSEDCTVVIVGGVVTVRIAAVVGSKAALMFTLVGIGCEKGLRCVGGVGAAAAGGAAFGCNCCGSMITEAADELADELAGDIDGCCCGNGNGSGC